MPVDDPSAEINGVFIVQGALFAGTTGFDPPPARKYRGNLRACILAYMSWTSERQDAEDLGPVEPPKLG